MKELKKMLSIKKVEWALCLGLLSIAFTGIAQIAGPMPLAWRWVQSTQISPSGSPLVKGDSIFAAVGQRIYALDRRTGNEQWRFPAGAPLNANFRNGAILFQDTIVAGSDNRMFYAVEASTGKERWSYQAPSSAIGEPVVVGQFLVLGLGSSGIMAIEGTTGQQAWPEALKITDGTQGSLASWGTSILVFTQARQLLSIDVVSKKVNWRAAFAQLSPDSSITVYGDTLYLNSGTFLTALAAQTGRKKWERDVREELILSPAVSAEGIFVVTRDGKGISFDLTGRPLMKKMVDFESTPLVPPAFVGSFVAQCTANGNMQLINPKTGELLWSYTLPTVSRVQPTSSGSGSSTTKTPFFVQAAGAPVLATDSLIIIGRDGSIFGFDKQFGVDLTPPSIKMLFPNVGDQLSSQPPFQFVFKILDETTGVKASSIRIEADGQTLEHVYSRDGYVVVSFSGTKNRPLSDGIKKVVVSAMDWLGNLTSETFTVIIDNKLKPYGPGNPPGGGSGGGGTPAPGGGGRGGGRGGRGGGGSSG